MAEFRDIIAGGDLIRQRKQPRWWFFGDETWAPWRNLEREVRYFEEEYHRKVAEAEKAKETWLVARTNVRLDKDMLSLHLLSDSDVSYERPTDESILFRRDDVTYDMNPKSGNQKQKGNQNNNGNGNQQNQKGNGNNSGNGNNQNQNQNQNQKGKQNQKSGQSFTITLN